MNFTNAPIEHPLRHLWLASTVVAALFVAAQGLWQALAVLVLFPAPWSDQSGQSSIRWEVLRSEWGIYLAFAVVAAAAGYLLWRAAADGVAHDYVPLLARAVLLYFPVSIVFNFVIGFGRALAHGNPFQFFGLQLLS